jgi:O-antigen/teichoic acid export membrane protein
MSESGPQAQGGDARASPDLLGRRLLGTNALLNLLGMASPALFALVAIPILVGEIGVARFGMLALAWALIGSFGIFDLGLGRALTQEAAALLGKGREDEVPALSRSYLRLLAYTGLAGVAIVLAAGLWGASHALNVSGELRDEVAGSVPLLALALPFVVVTTGLRGLLEAYQAFGRLTAIRVPLNAATFFGPVALLPFTHSLVALVAALFVARVVGAVAHLAACRRTVPDLLIRGGARLPARRIWRFARWMAITNLIAPLLVQMDRFAIGIALSASAVAFYAAPSDVITRIVIVPLAVVGVLFPALATTHAFDPAATARLFARGCRLLTVVLIPAMLVLFVYAPELLDAWLGSRFADPGTPILRWLALGVLVNSVGQVPFALIQAVGRPDLTARLHLAELPLYLLALWFALEQWGLVGVAAAWCVRALLDTGAMFVIGHRVLAFSHEAELRIAATVAACFAAPAALAIAGVEDTWLRTGALVLGLALLLAAAGGGLVERSERAAVRRAVRGLRMARRVGA